MVVGAQHHGFMVRTNKESCKPLDSPCTEDCECCGFDENPTTRCEKRNKSKGYRCYKSLRLGETCGHDDECRTQKCVNGKCVPYFPHGPKVPICSLTKDSIVKPIVGLIDHDNVCDCCEQPEPTIEDAMNALDGDISTIYVNNWAIGGGIEVQPKHGEGLHSLKVCNSDDCPDCDPTCYKIEGLCTSTDTYEPIQEGPLPLPIERNQCVTIRMVGKPLYSSYRITFPCQRGTCRDSCAGDCHARPISNPKLGPCEDYVDDGVNTVGSLKFISKEFEVNTTRTIFYYSMDNINLMYAMLAWEGDCRVDHWLLFRVVNGKSELEDPEQCCFTKCGNDFVYGGGNEDHALCMQGVQFYSRSFVPGEKYLIKLYLKGHIEETTVLPYGMINRQETEYGEIESPKCPEVLCPATCPLKVSEISMHTQECDFNSDITTQRYI